MGPVVYTAPASQHPCLSNIRLRGHDSYRQIHPRRATHHLLENHLKQASRPIHRRRGKMTMAVALGAHALLQLGLGVSDVATLISLGRSAGNWITTQSGDDEFLRAINGDANSIILRKGLIDLDAFNKRWRKDCTLLVNGVPQKMDPNIISKSLEYFSRFTATMVSMVTVLDAFLSSATVSLVTEQVLIEMLRTTTIGEDLLKAEISNRIRSWRSAGTMRGMTKHIRQFRMDLVRQHHVMNSYPPISEAPHFRELLVWLLLGSEDKYVTPSSDVAAVALGLSFLAFDLLGVSGFPSQNTTLEYPQCVVVYDFQDLGLFPANKAILEAGFTKTGSKRVDCMTIPLEGSEEAVSVFPLSFKGREACRFAWTRGIAAAEDIRIQIMAPTANEVHNSSDLTYLFSSHSSDRDRPGRQSQHQAPQSPMNGVLDRHNFCTSNKMYQHFEEAAELHANRADWLLQQTGDGVVGEGEDGWVSSPEFYNELKIEAFSVMQSFLMGLYYTVFLRLVDTSGLQIPVVDGHWGFRSTKLLNRMRKYCKKAKQAEDSHRNNTARIKRQDVIEILCTLLFNQHIDLENRTRFSQCVGVVGSRTLLTASLIRPTDCPNAVGRFVLLDVDTGGIPRDSEGVVRPGEPDSDLNPLTTGTPQSFVSGEDRSIQDDITRHIEADWTGNRERLLLTFRYKGRRLFSLNPAETDLRICHSYVEPTDRPHAENGLKDAIQTGVSDLLERRLQTGALGQKPVLFQAYDRPNLRYACVGAHYPNALKLASNCTMTALKAAPEDLPPIVVAAEGPNGLAIRQKAARALHASAASASKMKDLLPLYRQAS